MKQLYPDYYKEFRCIAAACSDSCCQGWDVVIDEDTEAFYRTVAGDFGDKLRSAIVTDADGDRVFTLAENKKCPFWSDDKLCDIYRTLGEKHLCGTCARFPRITMDYTVFCEHTLALACPEAARLILSTDGAYQEFKDIAVDECEDYDAELMRYLLQARAQAATILTEAAPLEQRFDKLLRFAKESQETLTGYAPSAFGNPDPVYKKLEYIDDSNRLKITRAAAERPDLSLYEKELTRLSLYLLYRYFLEAIDSLDLIFPVRFIISAAVTVAALAQTDGDIITAAQTYSKEVEQSYENMELLRDAFTGAASA